MTTPEEEGLRPRTYLDARGVFVADKKRSEIYYKARRILLAKAAAARAAAGAGPAAWPPRPSVFVNAPTIPSLVQRPRDVGLPVTPSGGADEGALLSSGRPLASPLGVRGLVSPLVKSPLPNYLCEAALRLQITAGRAVQSTARCSTITQDMELGESSSEGTASLERMTVATLSESTDAVPFAIEDDGLADAVANYGKQASRDSFGNAVDSETDFRVTNRIGEPCGMGPLAGKITSLRFCPGGGGPLAAGTDEGHIFLLRGIDDSSNTNVEKLFGHSGSVLDMEWSESGHYLLSVAMDKTIRIWWVDPSYLQQPSAAVHGTQCVREIMEQTVCLCIRFTPSNNNIFAVGTASSYVKLYNLSTGKVVKRHKMKRVPGYFAWTPDGDGLFVADAEGNVTAYKYEYLLHGLRRASTVVLSSGNAVTSLSYHHPDAEGRRGLLLANVMHCGVFLLKALSCPPFTMSVLRKVPIPHRRSLLRSAFCPLLERSQLAIVSGSEDGSLWVIYPGRRGKENDSPHMKLQGHQGVVLNVAVDSTGMIASGDELGCVMIWRCFVGNDEEKTDSNTVTASGGRAESGAD